MPTSPDALTWAMLLAKWTEFAKASVALPDEGEGGRVKRAVPALIGLQSVTRALEEVDALPADERAAGLDMAGVLITSYAAQIHEVWKGAQMHPQVRLMLDDARQALGIARQSGVEWTLEADRLLAGHPAELLARLAADGFGGDLYVPAPGVPLFRRCPVAFARGARGGAPSQGVMEAITLALAEGIDDDAPRQSLRRANTRRMRMAYRQFDFGKGGPVRDLVVVHDASLPAGQPLLVPAMLAGAVQPVPLPLRAAAEQSPLPVEFESASPDAHHE